MKKTSSTQAQSTSQTDARQALDNGSLGNTGSGSTVAGMAALSGSGNTINMLDGGLIDSAFAYLTERDASGAKQVDTMLDTSRSAIELAVAQNSESKANTTMIYALSAVAAVMVLKGVK